MQKSLITKITTEGNTMKMHNPPHPAETLRKDVLLALGLSVTEAADQLGISRVTFSRLLNGHASISVDMARRLEAWLGGPENGPSAESWLRCQLAYDLWHAEQQGKPNVTPAVRPNA